MTYLQHKDLKPEDFKRLCGVHKETFARMLSVITEQVEQKKRKPGKPSKLSIRVLAEVRKTWIDPVKRLPVW